MSPKLPPSIGRYQIEALLGRGGMGVVYKAFDPLIGRTLAVKVIGSQDADALPLQRLLMEARACGRLTHPNIVTVYELHEPDGIITMEYLEGESLAAAIARGNLSLPQKLTILTQMLSALEYAHTQGVVHRDIKPSNVYVLPSGTVKLLDFGLARIALAEQLTLTGAVIGTPSYMSPEQLKGQDLDGRTDVYSTGVVAYELLTGRRPFEGQHFTSVMLRVLSEPPAPMNTALLASHPELERIVLRAMEKAPADRYQTAETMRAAIAPLLETVDDSPDVRDATLIATRPAFARDSATELLPRPPARTPERVSAVTDADQPLQHARQDMRRDDARSQHPARTVLIAGAALLVLAAAGVAAWLALGTSNATSDALPRDARVDARAQPERPSPLDPVTPQTRDSAPGPGRRALPQETPSAPAQVSTPSPAAPGPIVASPDERNVQRAGVRRGNETLPTPVRGASPPARPSGEQAAPGGLTQPAGPPQSAPSPAPTAGSFTVQNRSGRTIIYLYFAGADDAGWSENRLQQVLPSGGRFTVVLPRGGGCLYDVRVVYEDRSSQEHLDQNVCTLSEVVFAGNR